VHDSAHQVESVILGRMEGFKSTLCGGYSIAGGQWYFSLNEFSYSEQYVEITSQQVYSCIVARMMYVTLNIMWKLLHSSWTVGF